MKPLTRLFVGYAPMAEWSPAAGAGTSSFGMSGTNAYALAVHPEEPFAMSFAKPLKWQRLRCELLCTLFF